MLQAISQTTKALYDTVILKLEGYDPLADVSNYYGIPYIPGYLSPSWRKAIQAVALGHRGTFGTLFNFIRNVTEGLDETFTYTITSKTTMTIVGGTPPSAGILGRLVELSGVFYLVTNIAGNVVTVAKVSTGYFRGGDFDLRFSPNQQVIVKVCAFIITEPTPGRAEKKNTLPADFSEFSQAKYEGKDLHTALSDACKVYIAYTTSEPSVSPPTYMQPAGAAARPAGQPFGGEIQENETKDGQADVHGGPHPPYLTSSSVFGMLLLSMKSVLPAGVIPYAYYKHV